MPIKLEMSIPLTTGGWRADATPLDDITTIDTLPPGVGHKQWKVFRVRIDERLGELPRCEVILAREEDLPPAQTPPPETMFDRARQGFNRLDNASNAIDSAESAFMGAPSDTAADAYKDAWENYGDVANSEKDRLFQDAQDVFSDPDRVLKEFLGVVEQEAWWGGPPADPAEFIGTARTVRIVRTSDDTVPFPLHARTFHGVVTEMEDLGSLASGYRAIRVILRPALEKLSLRKDHRVFQDLDALEIVKQVVRGAGLYPSDTELSADLVPPSPKREYCYQHNQTDLEFVLWLLAEEGLVCAFDHQPGGERMVILDGAHPELARLQLLGADGGMVSEIQHLDRPAARQQPGEHVIDLRLRKILRPWSASHRDFNFSDPFAFIEKDAKADPAPSVYIPASTAGTPDLYTLETYTGGIELAFDAQGNRYAESSPQRTPALYVLQARAQEELVGAGESNALGLAPGLTVTVTEGRAAPPMYVDGYDHSGDFLVTESFHLAEVPDDVLGAPKANRGMLALGTGDIANGAVPQDGYVNRFRCIPAAVPFRVEPRPRPRVEGLETALVVGATDDDGNGAPDHEKNWIHVDALGRVLVRFHWDRRGETDEARDKRTGRSCWIRVAQRWAGFGFGAAFVPRIGMEVVVSYLDGDPDLPVVVGAVHNRQNPAPRERKHIDHEKENKLPIDDKRLHYDLTAAHAPEDGKALTMIRTQSHLGGQAPARANGYNELSFDDTAGHERIRIHAEGRLQEVVRHDHTTEVANDQINVVQGDQFEEIGAEADGGQKLTVGGERKKLVKGHEQAAITKDRTEHVHGNENIEIGGYRDEHVKKKEKIQIGLTGGSELRELTVEGDRHTVTRKDDKLDVKGKQTITCAGNFKLAGAPMDVISRAPPGGAETGMTVDEEGNVTVKAQGEPGEVNLIAHGPGEDGTVTVRGKDVLLESGSSSRVRFEVDEGLFLDVGPQGIEMKAPRRVVLECGASSIVMEPAGDHERITISTRTGSRSTSDETARSPAKPDVFFMSLKALGTPGGQDASFEDVSKEAAEGDHDIENREAQLDQSAAEVDAKDEGLFDQPGILLTGHDLKIESPMILVKSEKGVNIQDEKDDGTGVLSRRILSDSEEDILKKVEDWEKYIQELKDEIAKLKEELAAKEAERDEQRAKVDELKKALDAGPGAERAQAYSELGDRRRELEYAEKVLADKEQKLAEAEDREDDDVDERRMLRDDAKAERDKAKQRFEEAEAKAKEKEDAWKEAAKEHDAERDKLRAMEEDCYQRRKAIEAKEAELEKAEKYLAWLKEEAARRTSPRSNG